MSIVKLTTLIPFCVLASVTADLAADDLKVAAESVCIVKDVLINESSGLAVSYTHPGSFWIHNDSGDSARLFLVGADGSTMAIVNLPDATAVDWEDMCSFRIGEESWLLIGDVGDNDKTRGGKRPSCQLYLVKEPIIGRSNGLPTISVQVTASLAFEYEDGARDCEGLAVDTERKEILLLTKSLPQKCGLYSMPLQLNPGKHQLMARRIASPSIPFATSLDISPEGRTMAIATVLNGLVVRRKADQTWTEAFAGPGLAINLPPRKQGECICFDASGRWMYLHSEEIQQAIWKMAVP